MEWLQAADAVDPILNRAVALCRLAADHLRHHGGLHDRALVAMLDQFVADPDAKPGELASLLAESVAAGERANAADAALAEARQRCEDAGQRLGAFLMPANDGAPA